LTLVGRKNVELWPLFVAPQREVKAVFENPNMFKEKHMKKSLIALVAVSALFLSGCAATAEEPDVAPSASEEMTQEMPASVGDIVAVASETSDFSTLVAAVTAADLVTTLQGTGPFTVFAPTNEAFAALPAGVLDALLLPENVDVLTQILTYHVVSGAVLAADVVDGTVATVEGQNITLATTGGVTVNGVPVATADVMASNGVIHVIGTVLLPPGLDVSTLL
jgi:uncharacterized surface protein with fasciclin (FAS1) repeats